MAKILVEYGAPLDLPLTSPPLWEAIANKRWECSKLLIDSGCSVHAPPAAPNPSFYVQQLSGGKLNWWKVCWLMVPILKKRMIEG